jgi:hypothetical protein
LTPPAVRPETRYFCRNRNSTTTGTDTMLDPAAN